MRIDGRADETLHERLQKAVKAISQAHARGVYDTAELLRWLDTDDVRAGTAFRPAFDINYVFHADGLSPDGSPNRGIPTPVAAGT